jgi:hypothetical protein
MNMAGDPYEEVAPAQRRRLMFRTVLRGLLITTVLVVLYYLLPLDRPWKPAPQLVCWLASWSSGTSGMAAGQKNRSLALPGSTGSRCPGFDRSPLPAAVRLDVLLS